MGSVQAILDRIMAKQFGQFDASKLIALSSGFELLKQQTGGQWRWGTACSGLDVVFCALEALQQFWVQRIADVPGIEHTFSCEQVEFKQDWIREFFSPKHMFADIHRLPGDSVQDWIREFSSEYSPSVSSVPCVSSSVCVCLLARAQNLVFG